jgi:hypothetical protein
MPPGLLEKSRCAFFLPPSRTQVFIAPLHNNQLITISRTQILVENAIRPQQSTLCTPSALVFVDS